MKYCTKCGSQIDDATNFCPTCGNASGFVAKKDDTLITVAKVFMILSCVGVGWTLIPLCWMIPMTVSLFNKAKTGEPITTGFKVCTLLFVSLVAGICLLCDND